MSTPIDDSLYSRQRYVLGDKAMAKMASSNILLSGLGGLGIEIAKNIALAGVKLLTLHDQALVSHKDLATQFYLQEKDIGKNRATVSLEQISQLNPYVRTTVSTVDLLQDLSFLSQFKCVILTEAPHDLQLAVNEYCHNHNICFISGDVRGLFCWSFVDFGNDFEVWDKDGEEYPEVLIQNITKDKEAEVTCLEHHLHGLEDGDTVTFREVKGMTPVNSSTFKVTVVNPKVFKIGDTSSFPPYEGGGTLVHLKSTINLSFKPLKESIENPEILIADYAKFSNPDQIHLGHRALIQFEKTEKRLPKPWDLDDANKVLNFAKQINEQKKSVETLDEKLLKALAFTSSGSLLPLTSFLGGVLAQEALKALTGKYTPLKQWLYLDAIEVLPEQPDPSEFIPQQPSRYQSLQICLGKTLCEKLANTRLFMIGAGAIGCELLKNFAMLGVSSGEKGLIVITDNDHIEKSNLNRQFLFRPNDIQKPKSTTAAEAAHRMNGAIKVEAHQDLVAQASEEKYSDKFFEDKNVIVNALDNVAARLYVDSRCVTNQRPLLESGTLATKGHVQVILPFLTESYASKRDPPEKDFPYCTLKSFPFQIEHTIQWARDFVFEKQFVRKPSEFNLIFELPDPSAEISKKGVKAETLAVVAKLLRKRPKNFDDCVSFARIKFEKYYHNTIAHLLHNFPVDHKLLDGTPFWSSPKRAPTTLKFDVNDQAHLDFVISFANLWAYIFNLTPNNDVNAIKEACLRTKVPVYEPSSKKIETDENKKEKDIEVSLSGALEDQYANEILKTYKAEPSLRLRVVDFEKDDDKNFHIDMINSASNLRSRVYSIPEVDRLKTKRIAGRIMPAIATTTSAVSGLVSLEFIKVVDGTKKLEAFKNAFMNLALPLFSFSEPGEAEKIKITDKISHTFWERWEVKQGDITLQQFVQYFKDKYALTVTGVFQETTMVFVPMFPAHIKRLPSKLSALLKPSGKEYVDLIVSFVDDAGEEVNTPTVRFHLP